MSAGWNEANSNGVMRKESQPEIALLMQQDRISGAAMIDQNDGNTLPQSVSLICENAHVQFQKKISGHPVAVPRWFLRSIETAGQRESHVWDCAERIYRSINTTDRSSVEIVNTILTKLIIC